MTGGRFQLILVTIAILIYTYVLGKLFESGNRDDLYSSCIWVLGFIVFFIVSAGFLFIASYQRISYKGGLIISLYLPMLLFAGMILYERFWPRDYPEGIKIFYEDERKGLAESIEHLVIDNSLVKPPYRFHFMAVKQLCDDTSKYASYFFYTPQDSPEWKAFIIVSDLDGNTFVERSMTAADSFTSRLYHYKLTQYEYADDFIGGSNNAGTHPLSQNDSVFIDAFTHEMEDTVSMNDIVSAPYIP
ncbi:MAG: hypothetical protein JST76_12365 [Bacteroidetes bacterium]|nr:hypothetical protein [Bacteroidota bacterium]